MSWRPGATAIVGGFEDQLEMNVLLAFFIPAIVYMADAVGTQTETVLIRALSAIPNAPVCAIFVVRSPTHALQDACPEHLAVRGVLNAICQFATFRGRPSLGSPDGKLDVVSLSAPVHRNI